MSTVLEDAARQFRQLMHFCLQFNVSTIRLGGKRGREGETEIAKEREGGGGYLETFPLK